MPHHFLPKNAADVVDTVKWAAAENKPLEVRGTGTKCGLGRPLDTGHILDLSAVSGLVNYEPAELIMTLRPGTPLQEVFAALNAANQMLAFEPMDLGPLYGTGAGLGTIGGVISTNLSGPRRLTKGAARDHVLGLHAVSGRGERFKAGGYVVKNVTGYDLCKGLTGAFGTLGVLTEVTIKTVPRPETEKSLFFQGLDNHRAMQTMAAALGSAHEVAAAAHVPADLARRSQKPGQTSSYKHGQPDGSGLGPGLEPGSGFGARRQDAHAFIGGENAATLLRLEGIAVSVDARAAALRDDLRAFGQAEIVEGEISRDLWRQIKDVEPLIGHDGAVWKLSLPPISGAKVLERIKRALPDCLGYFDWAGGLIWLLVPPVGDRSGRESGDTASDAMHAGALPIRSALAAEGGGHATLMRGDTETRASVPVFQPQEAALAALSKRVKTQFDPKGILNPGRMVIGA